MTPYTLQSYLPLYLGQKVKCLDDNRVRKLVGLNANHDEKIVYFVTIDNRSKKHFTLGYFINEFQLILRPLSSMTEEEKTEYNHRKQRKGYMAQVHADNTLWLLSKGFDIFSLREKNLCIYESDLNPEGH